MTSEAKSWLPPANSGEAETAIARVAEDWLARWLVNPPPLGPCKAVDGSARAAASDDALAALGLAVCAGRGELQNGRDREFLEALGGEVIGDLRAWLASATVLGVGAGDAMSDEAQLFEITPEYGNWSITVPLMRGEVTAIRKRAAGTGRKIELGSLSEALAGETALVGCHLGSASLTAAEVAAIGLGDLIVLSGQIAQAMPVTVEHAVCAGGRARVTQMENAIGIRLTEPITLEARTGERNG